MAVISKAALARELGVSRPRIAQLARAGLPVRSDGKLNRMEAVEWVAANIDSTRGGWGEGMRPKKNAKASDAGPEKAPEPKMPQHDCNHDYQLLPAYWR